MKRLLTSIVALLALAVLASCDDAAAKHFTQLSAPPLPVEEISPDVITSSHVGGVGACCASYTAVWNREQRRWDVQQLASVVRPANSPVDSGWIEDSKEPGNPHRRVRFVYIAACGQVDDSMRVIGGVLCGPATGADAFTIPAPPAP